MNKLITGSLALLLGSSPALAADPATAASSTAASSTAASSTAASSTAASSTPRAFVDAAEIELQRAMDMRLPDQPSPYLVSAEMLDGEVATAEASLGAITGYDDGPYRQVRVEVRVGDYALDNGNFEGGFGAQQGVRMRLLPDEEVALSYRRELWRALDDAYKGAAQQLSDKLAAREGVQREQGPDLYRVPPLVTDLSGDPPTADGALMTELVTTLTQALRDRGLEDASAVARDWQGDRVLISTEGQQARIPTGFTVLRVEAIARADDGARLRDARWWVADSPDDLPPVDEMLAEVEVMAAWLEGLRTAPVEEDYLGPVIFEQPAAVELFRQLLAAEMSGTPPAERAPTSFESGEQVPTARLGRRLLPQGWTVVDDPQAGAALGLPGGFVHDQEGVEAQSVSVVEDGVVTDLLMSRVPRKGFEGSTGHGRSLGSDRRIAIPAFVTVHPKRAKADKKLRKKGLSLARQTVQPYVLVVRRLDPPGLAEDFRVAFSGEAPLPGLTRPLEAYRLYPDGHEEPVRGLEFVGVDRRVLRDIVVAGRTGGPVGVMDAAPGSQRFSVGAVGGLPGSWTVPSVLVSELELHGSGGREPRVLPPPDFGDEPVAAGGEN